MFFASLVLAAVSAQAAVLPRNGGLPPCDTLTSGYLSATVNTVAHSFMNATEGNTIIYGDTGADPLFVDFQVCHPRGTTVPSSGYGPVGKFTGRLVEVASGLCLTVVNANNAAPPYYPALASCEEYSALALPSPAQTFALEEDGLIYFVGSTAQPSGPTQGGCTGGFLGYASDSTGAPTIDNSRHIHLTCANEGGAGFVLSPKKD